MQDTSHQAKDIVAQHIESRRGNQMQRQISIIINVCTIIIVFITAISLKDEIINFIYNATSHVSNRLMFAVFVISSIQGFRWDTHRQADLYARMPPHRKVVLLSILYGGVLIACAAWVWYTLNSPIANGLAISVFVTTNLLGWWRLYRPLAHDAIIANSRVYAQAGDRALLHSIETFHTYSCGRWQFVRFAIGFLIAVSMLLFGFVFRDDAAFMHKINSMGFKNYHVALLLIFVAFFEGSIWISRLCVWIYNIAIDVVTRQSVKETAISRHANPT